VETLAAQKTTPRENPLANLLINVVIPVVLLKHLGQWLPGLSPLYVLLLSVAPPLSYGVWDLIRAQSFNVYSALGVLNVGLTGGFAVFQLPAQWFIVKEAALPTVLAIACWISSSSSKPLLSLILFASQMLPSDVIDKRLQERGNTKKWASALKVGTRLFGLSFVLSAVLNGVIAYWIFEKIDDTLPEPQKAEILNQQIAQMTWLGFAFIAVPCLIVSAGSLYWVLRRLSELTGWSVQSLLELKENSPDTV
jgi:hypothetical protein